MSDKACPDWETVTSFNGSWIDLPKPKYRIKITDGVSLEPPGRMPNLFHRTMMKVFFGWQFESLAD